MEDEGFDHSLHWFDQPTAFWRANMQKVSERHPLTFSTYCCGSLWFSQSSLSAVTKAALKTWNFHLLFQRMCRDTARHGNFCFHQGEEREGVFSSSKVRRVSNNKIYIRKNYSSLMLFQGEEAQLKLQLWQSSSQMPVKISVFFF